MNKQKGYLYIGLAVILVVLFRRFQGANLEAIFSYIPNILHVPFIILLYGFIILGVPLLVVKGVNEFKK